MSQKIPRVGLKLEKLSLELVDMIENASKIVLLTHLNPDADTLGSASAMYDMLWRKQKKVTLFNGSALISHHLRQIAHMEKIQNRVPQNYDLLISFDCGDFSRLGFDSHEAPLVNIDHHISNERYGDLNIVESECVSTTQVVFKLFNSCGWKITPMAAQSLMTGLVSDSVCFGTDRVNDQVFAMASELANLGASAETAHKLLYEHNTLGRIRLAGEMINRMSLHVEGKVAFIYATQKMLAQTGAMPVDTEEALRMALSLGVVETVLMLREKRDGSYKGSLRSKGGVDVNKIASHFSGGGHKRASGFICALPMEQIQEQILTLIAKEL